MRQYYEILNLEPGTTGEKVKQAYKKLVKEWHPDRFPSDNPDLQKKAHRMFQKLSNAYSELKKFHKELTDIQLMEEQPEYTSFGHYPEQQEGEYEETVSEISPQFVTRKWENGAQYEGMELNDLFHGRGIYTFSNGDVFIGEFRFGKMKGNGQFKFKSGDQYDGEVQEDQMHGKGKITFSNGDRYIGQFANNNFHGEGILATTKKVYAGIWHHGSLVSEHR